MKHYSVIANFYRENSTSAIEGISFESLIDLIYSSSNKKIIFYNDSDYNKIVDNINLDWENNQTLILAPQDSYSAIAPAGFNQHNIHSIEYFTRIYSAFKSDIQTIFCANSQKKIIINKSKYQIFEINNKTEYQELLDFCESNYDRSDLIDSFNQYAKRGGIIDIYPANYTNPKRISFLNEKTEIKEFDINNQRTFKNIEKIKIAIPQIGKTLHEVLVKECNSWYQFKIDNRVIVIHNNINNKKINFPFKKINYSEFKKIKSKYKVSYQKTNRMNGFIYQENQIIAPSWFRSAINKVIENKIIDIAEINIGDYVVHRDHGVGKFIGLKYVDGDNYSKDQELIIIKYKDNCNIVVDINHLDKITFYAEKNDSVSLDSLTSPGKWNRKRNNAQKNVQNIVNKLVNAYVNRENSYRNPIMPDADENKFINEFEYIETIDQSKCWEDIKNDIEESIPMDRLICGDVGFGKTELAIRTTYRYISNNKKVIVLAPTTILCEQLFQSFYKRLNPYGVIMDRISRLRTKKEIEKIKESWINGQLDIVIGTHAILYNDIYLNKSDLLIIDEEHRFGVQQKEKIKESNPSIDILTMSATPIPRTLNMALSGMKQISTLTSAPKYRKAIITNINYFNDKLIINAINNEITRDGQIYFVHNNVKTIGTIMSFLEKNLPHLDINYIHGQMDSKIIEDRMRKFTNKNIDVLVCTSIIENGIDIPSVNTIIINNAHKFGLSQLYQIRGRVGRSNKQAYALLIIPKKLRLTTTSKLRLQTIEKYTSLGSGYKISNMDLTIRGGGSIFGYDQSGNIGNIGYELVSKFINEYIDESQSKINHNIKINFINKGIIPTSYIYSTKIRLLIYRKIKSALLFKEINNLEEELVDRFGKIPLELIRLIEIQKIHITCKENHINSIEENKIDITIQFQKKYWEQKVSYLLNKINEFINKQAINYEIKELEESLILKLKHEQKYDSLNLINQIIDMIVTKDTK